MPKPLLAKLEAGERQQARLPVGEAQGHREEAEAAQLRSGLDRVPDREHASLSKEERAAHVIGSVDHEEHGNDGVELSLDKQLRGKPGVMRTQADVRHNVFDRKYFTDPQPGKNMTLTIDERIQYVAERGTEEGRRGESGARRAVVVMNPKTGEILGDDKLSRRTIRTSVPKKARTCRIARNLAVSAPLSPGRYSR